jgi:hypothetical protein
MNHVTIFSNGIADFRRNFAVKQGSTQSVSIPVNRSHIGDILASLDVYGPVTLSVPPSFIPSNQMEGKLVLDTENVFCSLASKLVGAKVSVGRAGGAEPIDGILMGLHSQQYSGNGEAITEYYISILSNGKLRNVAIQSVSSLEFTDELVKAEIDKALRRQFESLRPQMTTINFEALGTKDGEMTVHYTVPTAAWKMSYRLRDSGAGVLLEGFAIVDNNTEEDWNNVMVSVVAGEPVTFNTDLAQSKIPARSTVNVVADRVVGAIEPERGYARNARKVLRGLPASNSVSPQPASCGFPEEFGDDVAALHCFYTQSASSTSSSTTTDESAFGLNSEVREVGDFSVFEASTPVSIGAGQSATLPMFSVALNKARFILYYRNGSERPYRSFQLRNETEHSLGRGICTVYQKGTYAGSCILPSCRQDEERMLPHALETGVRVHMETKNDNNKRCCLRISQGVAVIETRVSCETLYRVENTKKEMFELVLDHDKNYDGQMRATIGDTKVEPIETLKNGFRFSLALAPNDNVEFVVYEERVVTNEVHLAGDTGYRWLDNNIISQNLPTSKEIQLCIDIRKKLDAEEHQKALQVKSLQTVQAEQLRVIDLLKSDPTNVGWKNDLQTSEIEIRKLSRELIPAAQEKIGKLQEAFEASLAKVVFQWQDEQ